VLARAQHGVALDLVDVGMSHDCPVVPPERRDSNVAVHHSVVRRGTRDCASEASMCQAELSTAMECGRSMMERAVGDGCNAVALGEIGIGNTTAAAALLAALTGTLGQARGHCCNRHMA
jgi:nicotinate-nucleotide--dimethylbenzimidazole phosphoribosyltransferase